MLHLNKPMFSKKNFNQDHLQKFQRFHNIESTLKKPILETVINKITYTILSQGNSNPKTVHPHWTSKLHTTYKCYAITSRLYRAKNIATDFNKEFLKKCDCYGVFTVLRKSNTPKLRY